MRGCLFDWPTLQLMLSVVVISSTASTKWNDAIAKECESDVSKNNVSTCNGIYLANISRFCITDYWVSTDAWLGNCSFLLEQELTPSSDESLEAPVLHCKDDQSISLTWSKFSDQFDPLDSDNFIYLLEKKRENGRWTTSNVTRRLIGVARNLDPDVSYRFRVQKLGTNFRQISPEGKWIHTFRRWLSVEKTETLAPPIHVYQAQPFEFYENLTANVLIKWEPGEDRTCWYNVVIDNARHDEGIKHIPVHTAEAPMEKVISDLKIGVNYSVKVIGLERNHSHSGFKTIDSIPSCEVFPVNLTLTGPSEPNIKSVTHRVTEENYENYRIDVTVYWSPIPGGPPSNVTVLVESDIGKHYENVVGGKFLSGTVQNIIVRKGYIVEIFASSPGGEGKHKKTDFVEVRSVRASSMVSAVVGSTIGISVFCVAIIFFRRYKEKYKFSNKFLRNNTELKLSDQQLNLNSIVCYDDWEIPREKLVIGNEIGRGAFGTVHQALLSQPTGVVEVAVKKLRANPTSDDLKQFRLEMEIMKGVDKHPNVLSLVGCVTKLDAGLSCAQLLVVEYCALGDLQSFLRKAWKHMVEVASNDQKGVEYAQLILHSDSGSDSSSGSTCKEDSCPGEGSNELNDYQDDPSESQPLAVFNHTYGLYLGMKGGIPSHSTTRKNLNINLVITPTDLLSFARQVAIGMDFLSSNRVVHRDLAARNVLVCADRTVKISDFGLSRDIYEQNIYKKVGAERIPVKWLAIESLMHQIYTTQSDVWSFGILLWEIATLGGSPYPTVPNDSLFRLLSSGYRMERPATCGAELYKIMCDCWRANPIDRPTFHDLKLRLDNLLEAAAPHHYIHIDQLFAAAPIYISAS